MTAVSRFLGAAIHELRSTYGRDGDEDGLSTVADLAALMACADGTVDDAERGVLVGVLGMLSESGVHVKFIEHFVNVAIRSVEENGIESVARRLGGSLQRHDAVRPGLRVALAIAHVSRGISPEERTALKLLADAAGLTGAAFVETVEQAELELRTTRETG